MKATKKYRWNSGAKYPHKQKYKNKLDRKVQRARMRMMKKYFSYLMGDPYESSRRGQKGN